MEQISTFDNNREAPVDVVLERYPAHLRLRIAQLGRSLPTIDSIRALPVTTPKPLSDASLPDDLRSARAALNHAASTNQVIGGGGGGGGGSGGTQPTVSECIASFTEHETPRNTCRDSAGDLVTENNYEVFEATFNQYNANTKKWTEMPPWSSGSAFTAYGVCWAFQDCDGVNDVYWIQGHAFGQAAASSVILPGNPILTVKQGQSPQQFYWQLDNYQQPTLTDCNECDPYPGNQENPNSPIHRFHRPTGLSTTPAR